MKRIRRAIGLSISAGVLGLGAIGWLGCGDVDPLDTVSPETAEISAILNDKWQKGYMTEDVELYMSAYWADGFLYQSDMGTDADPTDDLIFDDIALERDAAIRVFGQFQDIEIEISEPPELTPLNEENTKYIVNNHYRIQLFVTEGTLEGGFTGAFAEGDSEFIFEKRVNPATSAEEWRIVEWKDFAFTEAEIRAANDL